MKIAKTRKIAQNPKMKEKREREKKKNLTISLKYATNVN